MPDYTFVVNATISLHVDVKADTLEEAEQKAQEAAVMGLCHQCAHGEKGAWNTSGELDTDPATSELVAVTVDGDDVPEEKLAALKEGWG